MVVKMGKIGIFHGYLGFTEGTYFLRWMIYMICSFKSFFSMGLLWVSRMGGWGFVVVCLRHISSKCCFSERLYGHRTREPLMSSSIEGNQSILIICSIFGGRQSQNIINSQKNQVFFRFRWTKQDGSPWDLLEHKKATPDIFTERLKHIELGKKPICWDKWLNEKNVCWINTYEKNQQPSALYTP